LQPILIKPVPFMMAQLALAATLLWHDPLAMQDVPCSYGRLSLPCTTWCFHLHNGLKITSDSLKREHYLPGKGKKKNIVRFRKEMRLTRLLVRALATFSFP